MRNKILLLAAVLISTFTFAQQKPSFGITAGLSSSGMRGDAVNNLKDMLDFSKGMITTSNRTGVFAGAHASLPVSNNISIQPSLYYAQKGYELKGELNIKGAEFLGVNARAELTSHYIDMPVLIKANISGLEVFAGPQLSYLAQADLRTTAGILGFNVLNKKMDATEQFNRWDAGITGGIGYQFTNGLRLMAAYDHGLSRVDADKNLESYNHSFKVGVGFSF